MSRALSVHQGKGATDLDARIGALLEAVESHAAEIFESDGPLCRLAELPEGGRAPEMADFAMHRQRPPPDEPYRWVAADHLLSGEAFYLPLDLVSLDLSRAVPSFFDRTSNGVATGASRREATLAALHEFLERDAVSTWQREGLLERMGSTIALDSIPYGWFSLWRERLASAGAALRLYRVPTLTGTPLIACEINDLSKDGYHYRAGQGRGCHATPEMALFKALAEALQARVTVIAGARDDLFREDYATPAGVHVVFGLPLPPGMNGIDWNVIEPGPRSPEALAEHLARASYPQVAAIELAAPCGLSVVRVFVCGLGSFRRTRREPLG